MGFNFVGGGAVWRNGPNTPNAAVNAIHKARIRQTAA